MRQHSPFISSIVKYYVNHQNETIAFGHKSLRNAVFARENENYASDADHHVAVESILKANQQHSLKLRRVNIDYQTLTKQHRCPTRYRILQPFTSNSKAHRNRFKPRDGSLFLPPPPKKKQQQQKQNNNNEMFIKLQGTKHRENSFAVPIINLSDQVVTDNVLLTLNLLFVRPILFANAEIFEGLMIQQWSPNLNKQVHSFVPKLFPSGTPKP